MVEKAYRGDDRGVSPVIAVILLVAITVILGTVIGSFVLGMGSNLGKNPITAFEMAEDGGDVRITHNGGDNMEAATLTVDCASGTYSQQFSGEVTAGDHAKCTGVKEDDTIQVIWTSESGGDSQILSTYTVPGGASGGGPIATIQSLDATGCTDTDCSGNVKVTVTFSGSPSNGEVFVYLRDAGGDSPHYWTTFTTSGDTTSFYIDPLYVSPGEDFVATVYEEYPKTNELDSNTVTEGTADNNPP